MTTPFTAQLAIVSDDTEYTASGGGSMFNPGEIAERLLPYLSGATLFAYLFRRFGYPNFGWDERKNLASYLLTTPRPKTFLTITPYMGSNSPLFMFGYMVHTDVEEIYEECITTKRHKGWQNHPLLLELKETFKVAIGDLLRPVFIDDVPIDCYGHIPDSKFDPIPSHDYVVERSPMAGYPIPTEFFSSVDRWESFCEALEILGQGNFEQGIQSVLQMADTINASTKKGK